MIKIVLIWQDNDILHVPYDEEVTTFSNIAPFEKQFSEKQNDSYDMTAMSSEILKTR